MLEPLLLSFLFLIFSLLFGIWEYMLLKFISNGLKAGKIGMLNLDESATPMKSCFRGSPSFFLWVSIYSALAVLNALLGVHFLIAGMRYLFWG